VGIDDNFFTLGGHSLLVVGLRARIAEELGRPVQIADLFVHPTPALLAEHLTEERTDS
jgi:hypothetical protein